MQFRELREENNFLSSFVPDMISKRTTLDTCFSESFVGFVLLGKIDGLGKLTREWLKTREQGLRHLVSTLNGFFCIIIEIIKYYKGDIIKISPSTFSCIFPVQHDQNKSVRFKEALSAALGIKDILKDYALRKQISFQLKQALNFGSAKFVTFGDETMHFRLMGGVANDTEIILTDKAIPNVVTVDFKTWNLTKNTSHWVIEKREKTESYPTTIRVSEARRDEVYEKNFFALMHLCGRYFENAVAQDKLPEEIMQWKKMESDALKNSRMCLQRYISKSLNAYFDGNNKVKNDFGYFRDITICYVTLPKESEENLKVFNRILVQVFPNCGICFEDHFVTIYLDIVENVYYIITTLKKKLRVISNEISILMLSQHVFTTILGQTGRRDLFIFCEFAQKVQKVIRIFPMTIIFDSECARHLPTEKISPLTIPSLDLPILLFKLIDEEPILEYHQDVIREDEQQAIEEVIVNSAQAGHYFGICFNGSVNIPLRSYHEKYRNDVMSIYIHLLENPQRPYFVAMTILNTLEKNSSTIEPIPSLNCMEKIQGLRKLNTKLSELAKKSTKGFTLVFIQDIQFIDLPSLEILQYALSDRGLRLFIAGDLEGFDMIKFKLSLFDKLKMYTFPLALADSQNEPLDRLSVFSTIEQIVIKACALFASPFERRHLETILQMDAQALSKIVKHLFDEKVLNCGSKYLVYAGVSIVEFQNCRCPANGNTLTGDYQHCRLINFMDKQLKQFIKSSIMTEEERREMQGKVILTLEDDVCLCPCCRENCMIPSYPIQKFSQLLRQLEEPSIIVYKEQFSGSNSQENYIKDIIRANLDNRLLFLKSERGDLFPVKNVEQKSIAKVKPLDSMFCNCFDLCVRRCTTLIESSKQIDHAGKMAHYLLEYAKLLSLLQDYNTALNILEKAEVLLQSSNGCYYPISDTLRILFQVKCKRLYVQIYLETNEISNAKEQLLICLQQYISWNLLFQRRFDKSFSEPGPSSFASKISTNVMQKITPNKCPPPKALSKELAEIMKLASAIFQWSGDVSLASMAALQSHYKWYPSTMLLKILIREGENLDKFPPEMWIKSKGENLIELLNTMKFTQLIFEWYALSGKIAMAIKQGFILLELARQIQAPKTQIVEILLKLLIYSKRFHDAVNLAYLFKTNTSLGYHIFCLELYIEAGFILEPVEDCCVFATEYFFNGHHPGNFNQMERKFALLLAIYHQRRRRFAEADKWRNIAGDAPTIIDGFLMGSLLLFHVERTMVVNSSEEMIINLNVYSDRRINFKALMDRCSVMAKKWQVFGPRCKHLLAHWNCMKGRKNMAKKLRSQAMDLARKQGNILEEVRLIRSGNKIMSNCNQGEQCSIPWRDAHLFSKFEWSNVTYLWPL